MLGTEPNSSGSRAPLLGRPLFLRDTPPLQGFTLRGTASLLPIVISQQLTAPRAAWIVKNPLYSAAFPFSHFYLCSWNFLSKAHRMNLRFFKTSMSLSDFSPLLTLPGFIWIHSLLAM